MALDLIGKRFGSLVVVANAGINKHKRKMVLCECDCGTIREMLWDGIRDGRSVSCGCYRIKTIKDRFKTHGKTRTPIYRVWRGMKVRCYDPNMVEYYRYGGRGITVCDEWKDSFEAFYRDMGDLPFPKAQIDRIDNDKGYYKENCRWVTPSENCRNKSNNIILTYNGESMCMHAWSERMGWNESVIRRRVRILGWDTERALTEPLNTRPRRTARSAA